MRSIAHWERFMAFVSPGKRLSVLLSCLVLLVAVLTWMTVGARSEISVAESSRPPRPAPEASLEQVERTCAGCHPLPPGETFPKFQWSQEVDRGLRFLRERSPTAKTPAFASLVEYFRKRAPDEFPALARSSARSESPLEFAGSDYRLAPDAPPPGIANVHFVHLTHERKLDLVACDMLNGLVLLLRPYEPGARLKVLTDAIPNPAHAEVVDLDADGVKDLLVADLGSLYPTEERVGRVVWLQGQRDGSFRPVVLAGGLGRVADVQAADFDGDGDLDLVVAEFGWLKTGRTLLLENRTPTGGMPAFAVSTVDPRHGAIHVPVADLNSDGRPDFVALISQEHETVVAFLNDGGLRFHQSVIHEAGHPAFGSSGIQLADLDGDGDLDVLLSNGDSMDSALLRPYHGVQWLENVGGYPYVGHHLTSMYGAQRAVAGDLDGDGDLDIAAVSFLPGAYYHRLSKERNLDAVVVLEQVSRGRFVRQSLETVTCDHATCDLGDFDDDGRIDLVTGNAFIPFGPPAIGHHTGDPAVVVRRNVGSHTGPARAARSGEPGSTHGP